MTVTERETTAAMFDGLLAPELAFAYADLLERGHLPEDEADSVPHLQSMLDLGLAYKLPATLNSPRGYDAVPLGLALRAALAHHLSVLAEGFESLVQGAGRLAESQAIASDPKAWPRQAIQLISGADEVSRISTTLMTSTQENWMTMETGHFDKPITDDSVVHCPASYRDRIRVRGIYEHAFASTSVGQRIIDGSIADGEQARILAGVPLKMKLADTSVALLPLSLTGMECSLLIYFQPLVKMLREYFEWVWKRATPCGTALQPPRDCPLNEGELTVLHELAQDREDAAIASRTGMSLSTVRRHVNTIKKALDVNGRFAAGTAAQRRGWLK